jgi:hypothetical protein
MFTIGLTEPTKEMLLEVHTEEYYMSYYLGIPIQKGLFCSPLRVDNNPTCSFFRTQNDKVLKMKDFATGFSGDFINIVMLKRNVTYYQALRIVANDFDIINYPNLEKTVSVAQDEGIIIEANTPAIIQVTIGEFSNKDLRWWKQFGISEETLKKYRVFRANHVFLNGSVISTYQDYDPSYAYYFGKRDGLELWKIYYPLRKKYRFLLNCAVTQGLDQLPNNGNILVVTKSLKDVMSLHELGISAIAPQAESVVVDPKVIEKLKPFYKYIVFNGDWDAAGKQFMIKNRKLYGGLCLTFKDKERDGKDVSDFIKIHGMDQTRILFEELKTKCKLI